jgi:dTMP kinase
MASSKGKLIVFEGTDGSGKATQSKMFLERLQRRGIVSDHIGFPRYTERFGKLIGEYLSGGFGAKEGLSPEFVALLYALDRYDFKMELERRLDLGLVVVCDRFLTSNLAHQGAKFDSKRDQDAFVKWASSVESRLPQPFKTVFLDLPPSAAKSLLENTDRAKAYRKGKSKDVHEEDDAYLLRSYEIYKRLAKDRDWITIECAFQESGEWVIRSKEEIGVEIWKKLEPFLKK